MSKKLVLLVGFSATAQYYMDELNRSEEFQGMHVKTISEALKLAEEGECNFCAVVTPLRNMHGKEFGEVETGDGAYTGAALARHLRSHFRKTIFFLFGAKRIDLGTLARYSGETSDIIGLPMDYDVTPDTLIWHMKRALSGGRVFA